MSMSSTSPSSPKNKLTKLLAAYPVYARHYWTVRKSIESYVENVVQEEIKALGTVGVDADPAIAKRLEQLENIHGVLLNDVLSSLSENSENVLTAESTF